jgi:pimeloyl-ACP methyl ester carboxylesterase
MKTLPVIDRPSWLPESAWPWPTYALDHDTGRIAVTDIGEGPPLLFVHVGSWSFVWRDVLLRLQHDFRCVTLDPPGSGLSDRSKSAPTLARAGDVVRAVVDELQLRDLTLVAHDLGGPAGFLAASRRADRVAAMVAVNCFAWRPTGALFGGMLAAMGSAPARELDAAIGWLPWLTATGFGVGRHWSRADLAVFRAGIDRSARRAWHGYFRDARHAHELYAELDAGLRGPLSDRPLLDHTSSSVRADHNDGDDSWRGERGSVRRPWVRS